LLAGFLLALLHHGLTVPEGATTLVKGGWIAALYTYPVEMAQNFWTAIIAFTTSCSLTVVLTLLTKQKKSDQELYGLVYSLTPRERSLDLPWIQRPVSLAIVVGIICLVLTIMFW
jgi:SSS family solute:Na+ symporter